MKQAKELHEAIASVCPIDGVSIGDKNDKTKWRVSYKPEATPQQLTAAQGVIDAFVWDETPDDPSDSDKRDRTTRVLIKMIADALNITNAQARALFKNKWDNTP